MSQILDQIKNSNLSKHGLTNPTGIFEGTPENVVAVIRGSSVPLADSVIPPIQNPIDVVYGAKPQPTYLDYLKSSNKT
jgi:hypothetical protein